jgi:cysteine desulfurase
MPKHRYYFDYASSTPLDPQVFSAMLPYFNEEFGNPSNLYELGRNTSRAISKATEDITKILGCRNDEFVYTGSATEADNLAILGIARANRDKGNQIIISQIEHKGILAACEFLEKEGFKIVRLPVLKNGLVDLDFLKKSLNGETILVSITMADSETGTIQPVSKISEIINEFRKQKTPPQPLPLGEGRRGGVIPYFHTDASQGAGYLDINTNNLGVDLMTLSAHKLYGPKGIGGLYVKKGTKINPIIYGGGQQSKLRSGTENVPAIIGFAKALKINHQNKKKESARQKKLRDILEKNIFKSIPKVVLNGHPSKRLPNFLNISILDIEGEALLLFLDELGIMVSTGSACNSQNLEPSYILTALDNPYEYVHGSIRFTLGKETTISDIKYVLKHLPMAVKKLRDISPLNLTLRQKEKLSNPKSFVGNQTPHFLRNKSKNTNTKSQTNSK